MTARNTSKAPQGKETTGAKRAGAPLQPKKITRKLEVDLDEEERLKLGAEAAAKSEEHAELDAELRDTKKRIGDRMKGLAAERDSLLHSLKTGTRERDVECEMRFDHKAGRVRTFRLDRGGKTGELVDDRPMTDTERQVTIPGTDGDSDAQDAKDRTPAGA